MPAATDSSSPATSRARSARTASSRAGTPDSFLAKAVDVARGAAEEEAGPGEVGEHLGVEAEGERLVTHLFDSTTPGYRGWRWAVTLSRVPRGRVATVCEAVLLPGPEALLPPEWVPWSQRLRAGDVGPGDLLPTAPDDPRLVPGFRATGDEDVDEIALWELGLGRPRVLSMLGRDEAADRWYAGPHGPSSPAAEAAPARCSSCGFLVHLAGSLRQAFGVCTNEYSPDDGAVVSLDHGCGAHSEAVPTPAPTPVDPPVLDDLEYETVARPARAVRDAGQPAADGRDAGERAADVGDAGDRDVTDAMDTDTTDADATDTTDTDATDTTDAHAADATDAHAADAVDTDAADTADTDAAAATDAQATSATEDRG